MSRSPSSIAVQSPIRTPYGSQPLGLSSKCPVDVQILFSLCPVCVQYLTSESEPPAMRLYEVDSFSSFRRRLRTPSRILDTWKSKVGTRESLILQPCHALDGQRPTVQRCLVDRVSGTIPTPLTAGTHPPSYLRRGHPTAQVVTPRPRGGRPRCGAGRSRGRHASRTRLPRLQPHATPQSDCGPDPSSLSVCRGDRRRSPR